MPFHTNQLGLGKICWNLEDLFSGSWITASVHTRRKKLTVRFPYLIEKFQWIAPLPSATNLSNLLEIDLTLQLRLSQLSECNKTLFILTHIIILDDRNLLFVFPMKLKKIHTGEKPYICHDCYETLKTGWIHISYRWKTIRLSWVQYILRVHFIELN